MTIAMPYESLAERLGITVASARKLVLRRRWARSTGNSGRTVVLVPEEFLQRRATDSPSPSPTDSHGDSPTDSPSLGPDARALIALLQGRVAELDGEVKELRPKAARAEVLEALLAAEQARVEEWKLVSDRSPHRLKCWPLDAPGGHGGGGHDGSLQLQRSEADDV
jgi:hypothetical protein